jgi:hypothetical protein
LTTWQHLIIDYNELEQRDVAIGNEGYPGEAVAAAQLLNLSSSIQSPALPQVRTRSLSLATKIFIISNFDKFTPTALQSMYLMLASDVSAADPDQILPELSNLW